MTDASNRPETAVAEGKGLGSKLSAVSSRAYATVLNSWGVAQPVYPGAAPGAALNAPIAADLPVNPGAVTFQAPGDLADANPLSIRLRRRHLSSRSRCVDVVPMAIPDIAGVALGLRVNAYDPHGCHYEPSLPREAYFPRRANLLRVEPLHAHRRPACGNQRERMPHHQRYRTALCLDYAEAVIHERLSQSLASTREGAELHGKTDHSPGATGPTYPLSFSASARHQLLR